nr:hypothetical protein [uncultured Vibrio sp.]
MNTTEKTDIHRIERMFTKATWLIGVVWTVTLGAGAFSFITSFSYLDSLVTNAETRVGTVSDSASEKINDAADKVVKDLLVNVSKQIDIVKLSEEVKNEKIPAIEKELSTTVSDIKAQLKSELDEIEENIRITQTKVDEYKSVLNELVEIQSLAEDMRVTINKVTLEPSVPRVGQPAQLIGQIYVPTTNKNQVVSGKIIFKAFGYTHETDFTLVGNNSLDISVPIVIPTTVPKSDVKIGEGSYAVEMKVVSNNKQLVLAQNSSLERVYN